MKTEVEKMNLLTKISECEFVMIDLGLFLDTHPDNEMALKEYHEHKKKYDALVNEYETYVGPLKLYCVESMKKWTWDDLPWPWEKEA